MSENCDFCTNNDFWLGMNPLDVSSSKKTLKEILEDESGKIQKIRNSQLGQNNRTLLDIFDLGEGLCNDNFNNLALNKIREERDAQLDQLFNMGSGLKIFDYMEAANLLLTNSLASSRLLRW